mgnify:CR=1 FL=1|tara:strand:+ start:1267 stop:1650 length:384 start_codon:yes stop_codon:yes gene_type:complete
MTDTPTPAHRFELGETYTDLNATWPLSDYDLKYNTTVAGHARVMGMEVFTDSGGRETHRISMLITYERADGTISHGGTFSREIEYSPSRDAQIMVLSDISDGFWWSADRTHESQWCAVFGDRYDSTQ